MKAVVLTEEAQTVAETADDPQLLEYYKGQFRPVASLSRPRSVKSMISVTQGSSD
jgi:hypothetical protein